MKKKIILMFVLSNLLASCGFVRVGPNDPNEPPVFPEYVENLDVPHDRVVAGGEDDWPWFWL